MKNLIFTFLLVLLLPTYTLAAEKPTNELTLEGFRDLKFGSSIDLVKDKMKFIPNKKNPNNPLKFYKREDDSIKFNGHKIHALEYAYFDGKFVGIFIYTRQPKSMTKIDEYLKDNFGEPTGKETSAPKKVAFEMVLTWNNDDIFCKKILSGQLRPGNVSISYNLFFMRKLSNLQSNEDKPELEGPQVI